MIKSAFDPTGFTRYQQLLDLFTVSASSWTVDELAHALGKPKSSVYRSVRELVAAGYLESAASAKYRLGPAFIVANRVIEKTDPLVVSGAPVIHSLAAAVSVPCVVVLARLYGSRVVCVADERTAGSHAPAFERGRLMPIDRGATSLAILAQARGKALANLLSATGVTDSERSAVLTDKLKEIRKAGIAVTTDEVDPGLTGWAVPVTHKGFGITASLSIVCSTDDVTDLNINELTAGLLSSGALIEKHMQLVFDEVVQVQMNTNRASNQ